MKCVWGAVLIACLAGARAGKSTEEVNPIRRVVTMLQMMAKKVEAEGKAEKELFDKFMCWCETGASDLAKSIDAGERRVPHCAANIKEMEALIAQLKAEIAKAKGDREAALKAVASLKIERAKGAAAFKKSQEDLLTNIAALKKAIAALEKGMAGAFLQTSTASLLRRLTVSINNIRDSDRDMLSAFLSGGQGDGAEYAPQSGEIVGILKQMLDTMIAQLKDVEADEKEGILNFELMLKAKLKLIDTLTKAIEEKLIRLGELMVGLTQEKEDLEDTSKSLVEDKKFLADMDDICAKKKAEWELRCKMRSEELLALADTIRILNDDDSLELFKKTLPSASLLQVTVGSVEVRRNALEVLHASRGRGKSQDYRVSLIAMALKGGKVSFAKVIKMIDDMVKLLGEEQIGDDSKKMYCEKEIDKTEDEVKGLDHEVEDLSKAIDDTKEAIATLTEAIAALEEGIEELDKSVAEATATRKEEHEDFVQALAANTAAKDILGIAKNRLNKFYNPGLYKPPPKRELTEAERITVNNGGTLAPTAPPAGIAGTGIAVFAQVAMTAPPTLCGTTAYGCCPGSDQAASGPNGEGCESPSVLNLGGCKATLHGCCPGSDQAASGPNGEGCEEPVPVTPMIDGGCGTTAYGCCPGSKQAASGPNGEGCESPSVLNLGGCKATLHGCCPGSDQAASGPNGEGCESDDGATTKTDEGAPPPPPETFGAYQKKGEANSGVMAMIGELEAELDKDIQEGKVDEKHAQEEYEEFIADSAAKRVEDAKSMKDKMAAKAQGEVDLQKMTEEKKEKLTESMAKAEALKDLHLACDWLLENYGTRKEARAGEVSALKKAKAVLSGADYSLVQTNVRRLRGA